LHDSKNIIPPTSIELENTIISYIDTNLIIALLVLIPTLNYLNLMNAQLDEESFQNLFSIFKY